MLSIFLVAAIGFVGWNAYKSWKSGPWDLPAPDKTPSPSRSGEKPGVASPRAALSTDVIVAKNLFDPERGAGATREVEAKSLASQRIHNMILVGTVVIGGNRTAVLEEPGSASTGPASAVQPARTLRLRLGDDVDGYKLSEIADKRVVFTKDAARIELLLDYFRKVEIAPPKAAPRRAAIPRGPVAPGPRVMPNLPRRGRLPTPRNAAPDS